jgi:hypothetical protein
MEYGAIQSVNLTHYFSNKVIYIEQTGTVRILPCLLTAMIRTCDPTVIRLTKLNAIKEMFQVNKGSPVGLGMTSRAGGYDERTVDVKGKRYVLPPKRDPPVFSNHLCHLIKLVNADTIAIITFEIRHSPTPRLLLPLCQGSYDEQKPLTKPHVGF